MAKRDLPFRFTIKEDDRVIVILEQTIRENLDAAVAAKSIMTTFALGHPARQFAFLLVRSDNLYSEILPPDSSIESWTEKPLDAFAYDVALQRLSRVTATDGDQKQST